MKTPVRVLGIVGALAVLWPGGCRDGRNAKGIDGDVPGALRRVDPYAVEGKVPFHMLRFDLCLEPDPGRKNKALGQRARWALSSLRKARCAALTVLLAKDRALVQIPAKLWFGRDLDLVVTGQADGVLVDRRQRVYWQGDLGRLFDVLEGTGHRPSEPGAIKFLDDKPVDPAEGQGGARRLEAVLQRKADCKRFVEISVTYGPKGSLPSDLSRLMLRAVSVITGMGLDEPCFVELARRVHGPVKEIVVRSRCEQWPSTRKAVVRRLKVAGPSQKILLPADRAAVPPVEAQKRHGMLSPGPMAFLDASRLAPLRGWSGKLGPVCPLLVSNKSNRSAIVFADGIPLGVLSASTTISFEGLPCGYHHLAATSFLGVLSWGPLDTYVAGAWTLR